MVHSNLAAATAVVTAAAAKGSHPKLHALLVEPTWRKKLVPELEKSSAKELQSFLQREWAQHKVFPPQHLIFGCVWNPGETPRYIPAQTL